MKSKLNINYSNIETLKCTLSLPDSITDYNNITVKFENASLGKPLKIKRKNFAKINQKNTNFELNIKDSENDNFSYITIYASIFENEKLIDIAIANIENIKKESNNLSAHITPNIVEYGSQFTITVLGKVNSYNKITINNKTFNVNTNENGFGEINLNSDLFAKRFSKTLQQIKVFIKNEFNDSTEATLKVSPENAIQLATAAQSYLPELNIKYPDYIEALEYPSTGLDETADLVSKRLTLSGEVSFSANAVDFARIQNYSYCIVPPNSALVALSSYDYNKIDNIGATNAADAENKANRVYVLQTNLHAKYASPVRKARVLDSNLTLNDCSGVLAIEVDADIWADNSLTSIWILNGELKNKKFNILSQHRNIDNIWYITSDSENINLLDENYCFDIIAVGDKVSSYPSSITKPLPYIKINGIAVSSINPQIAYNRNNAPNKEHKNVYVVAEANVNGVSQLFLYSFNLDGSEVFGWKQLTNDGENKNAKIVCDSNNNLHIVWESSRCSNSQIFYGVLGPDSRFINNKTYISILDKLAEQKDESDRSLLISSTKTPLNLRKIDGSGNYYGDMWFPFSSNLGITNIINDGSVTVTGNPYTDKFAVLGLLEKDENKNYFNGYFSQLSYSVYFDLVLNSIDSNPNKNFNITTNEEILDLYNNWKQSFTPLNYKYNNINVYSSGVDTYTIGNIEYVYENIIPIVGSYSTNPEYNKQIKLKHFCVGIVLEKARFIATNISSNNHSKQEYYTGKFKLALITEKNANLNKTELAEQNYEIIRLIGDIYNINQSHSYNLQIHYSKARQQTLDYYNNKYNIDKDDLRFLADVSISVDNKIVCGESFFVKLDDNNFNIGLGCPIVHEYRPVNIKPFDNTLNEDIKVEMIFTNIAVGKHYQNPSSGYMSFSYNDRNVNDIFVPASTYLDGSANVWDEIYGPLISDRENRYYLTLGLDREKIALSQYLLTISGHNRQPSICLDKNDNLHIVWQSFRDDQWEIYYTNNLNIEMPFRFDVRITNSESDSLAPSVAVDNSGKALIVWHDNREGEFQIYGARNLTPYIDNSCNIKYLSDLGFNEYSDEYEYGISFSNLCDVKFTFTNSESGNYHHFLTNFYYDEYSLSSAYLADSKYDISNWFYVKNGTTYPLPYNGVYVDHGESVEIIYKTHKDIRYNQIYYVEVSKDIDGNTYGYDLIKFFCPNEQYPLCNVPCLYTNNSQSSAQVHFRVTFYRDSNLSEVAMSVASNDDNAKWYIGDYSNFPASGITVKSGETVSCYYNPDIVYEYVDSIYFNANKNTLLCNATYYVVVEAFVNSNYTTVDSFAFVCNCNSINNTLWRVDDISKNWISSGQNGSDIKLSNSIVSNLNAKVYSTNNGFIYMVWEEKNKTNLVKMSVWDANEDVFYTKSQGYFDKDIVSNFTLPGILVSNLNHPSIFCTNGNILIRNNIDAYTSLESSSSSSSNINDVLLSNQLNQEEMDLTSGDVKDCLHINVFKEDVVKYYFQKAKVENDLNDDGSVNSLDLEILANSLNDQGENRGDLNKDGIVDFDDLLLLAQSYNEVTSENTLPLVNKCKIRLIVKCPNGAYAIRLKNEEDAEWSDWISINTDFYQSSSSSSVDSISNYLNAHFISSELVLTNWVLSRGNGKKTVSCEIMTYFGVTPTVSKNILVRYKELNYKIDFYSSKGSESIPASTYNGYSVISKKHITVQENNVYSIADVIEDNDSIKFNVTFNDPEYLEELLSLNDVDRWGNGQKDLSFDLILPGKALFNLPLTKLADVPITFDYDNPPTTASKAKRSIYEGSFEIEKSDNFDNKDGLATILLRIPSPCLSQPASYICPKLYPSIEDIKDNIANEVEARRITEEGFYKKYNQENACRYMTVNCLETSDNIPDYESDDTFEPENNGPVSCEDLYWTIGKVSEPCFYHIDSKNLTNWSIESPEFELDFSDSRIDYLKFNTGSMLDGIIIMTNINENIAITSSACPSSSSSSSSNGKIGRSISVVIPNNAFIFKHTDNYYYCHGPSECNLGSSRKLLTNQNGNNLGDVEEGSFSNDGTDGSTVWHIQTATGLNLSSSSSSSSIKNLLVDLTDGISTKELKDRGYITSNGILRFKLVFIPSGVGLVDISITCGATCDD